MNPFLDYLQRLGPQVEDALDELLPASSEPPARLHEAMRYCVLGGGKRIRPTLTVLVGEACGAARSSLLAPAAALELIHTFSLVHDDLPALDNDDLRRGQPSVHRKYDEALAVLVGDSLLTLGLQILAEQPSGLDGDRRAHHVGTVARAVSSLGMIGGQVDDLAAEGAAVENPEALLESIHRRKTGALLVAAAEVGASCAAAPARLTGAITALAEIIGLMFQIRDDILDIEGESASLGKTAGKDATVGKLTYPAVYGLDESKARLRREHRRGLELVSQLPTDGLASARETFSSLLDFLAERGQ